MNLSRKELEKKYGKVWNVDEFIRDFEYRGSSGTAIIARHKDSNKMGTLKCQALPNYYFGWTEDVAEK